MRSRLKGAISHRLRGTKLGGIWRDDIPRTPVHRLSFLSGEAEQTVNAYREDRRPFITAEDEARWQERRAELRRWADAGYPVIDGE